MIGQFEIPDQQMEWSHDGQPNYVNWIFGQPESTENQYPGNSCGIIDKDSYENGVNWSALQCNKRAMYACQTLPGKQCPEKGFNYPLKLNTILL